IWNSLELYRSESGELRPLFQPVDLSELAQSCREEFTFLAQEKKLELVSKVAPHTTVKTDRLLMRRIMVNLIENALKNTPPGGAVTISAETRDDYVNLSVEDTGVGIEPEMKARVFDRFFAADARARGGVGIGLYLSKQLA